ncbi:CENP-B 2 [Glycine max]|nr:CENP-B 2 [Glycine max]
MEPKLVSIREKIDQLPMKDVFNMDETGLFYRLQVDHSLATKQLEGRKQDKERLTVVICCNEDGSEKIPLWIIGKYAKPHCFKNVNMNSLDCQYRANKKAWMTSVFFDEYVRSFDQMMHGRRVLLVVDNCPTHPRNIEGLRNVKLLFLPPNMTSKIQPCDVGIIRAFKMHYRRRFYRKILEGYEVKQSDPGKINVLDAINLAIPAWTIDVRKETIVNCFRHCKIRSASDVARNLDESTFDEETQDLETMINQCGYHNKMDIDNLMNYPGENEACSEVQSLEDIVGTIIENNAEDDGEDDTVSLEPVTRKEALMTSNIIHNFMIQYKNTTPELLDAIRKVRDELQIDLNFKGKQTTIESYFNRRFCSLSGMSNNKALVERLQRYGVITSSKEAEVMETVDKALFVPDGAAPYDDSPMAIGYNATISAPHMLEENLQPGMHALDVGYGTGYLTAALP